MYSFFEVFFSVDETVKTIPILCSKTYMFDTKFVVGYKSKYLPCRRRLNRSLVDVRKS